MTKNSKFVFAALAAAVVQTALAVDHVANRGMAVQRSILGYSPNYGFHMHSTSYRPPTFEWPSTSEANRAKFSGTAFVGIKEGLPDAMYVKGKFPGRNGKLRTEGGDILEVRGDHLGPVVSPSDIPLG